MSSSRTGRREQLHPLIMKVAVVIHTLLQVESELSAEMTLQQCHQPISDEREQRLSYNQE